MMRNAIAALVAAAALGGFSAGAQAADDIPIGAILSMSGAAPYYGQVMSQGAQLAMEEINADGGIDGKMLRLVIEDHKSGDTQAAVTGMNRLINVEGAQAVLSSFSGPTAAIAPISAEQGIFVLNGGGVSPKMIGVSDHMFHNRSMAIDLARASVSYAADQGYKRAAQIAMKSEFGDSVIAATEEIAKNRGMEVVAAEQFATDATNIDTQVAKIRASRPDVVLNWATTPQAGMVVKRLSDMAVTTPIQTMEWTAEDSDLAGAASDGVLVITDYFAPSDDNAWGQRFAKAYEERYGSAPDFYAANYYEAIYVIAELIRRVEAETGDDWTGEDLTAALWADNAFDSVYGDTMSFQENGVALKRVALLKVEGDKTTFVRLIGAAD